MWSDNETSRDLLGFRVHADLIEAVVRDPAMLPVTIGVYGDWGGGKTSVMRMLEERLNSEPEGKPEAEESVQITCLYFNGWLFEGYDDAKSAILSSILLQLATHQRIGPKIRTKALALLKSVDWMRLARLGFSEVALPGILAYLTGGVSLIPSLFSGAGRLGSKTQKSATDDALKEAAEGAQSTDWEAVLDGQSSGPGPMDVRTFRDRFAILLKESGLHALVVLIDDLDRCSPQRIVDNLEAIKLFLSVDRTAFVIGADPRIVRHAVATVYDPAEIERDSPDYASLTDIVTDYLEKVIQVPYTLPRLSPAEVETYMSLLFCQRHLDPAGFTEVCEASERHRSQDRYSVFGYGAVSELLKDRLGPDLDASLQFVFAAAALIAEGLKGNPRQVKRFLNAFLLRKKLAEVARLTHLQDAVLVKLMVLEYSQPARFNELYEWQAGQEGMPHQVRELESAMGTDDEGAGTDGAGAEPPAEWATPQLQRWIGMDPKLAEVDLRDYFWVARDRLQSVLSGVAMVPPNVRKLLEEVLSGTPGRLEGAIGPIRELRPEELGALTNLLSRHVKLNPSDDRGFMALIELARNDVGGVAEALAGVLMTAPPGEIEAAVGLKLMTLIRHNPALGPTLQPAIDRLLASKERVGAAIETTLAGRRSQQGP